MTNAERIEQNNTELQECIAIANELPDVEHIIVDDKMDSESTNPVQNKVITEALDTKADKDTTYTKTEVDGLIANSGGGSNNEENFIAFADYDMWGMVGKKSGLGIIGGLYGYRGEVYLPFSLDEFELFNAYAQVDSALSGGINVFFDYETYHNDGVLYYQAVDFDGNIVEFADISVVVVGKVLAY